MRIAPEAQLAVIGLGTLTVPLDTMVNVAFPHIVAAFGIAVPDIRWVVICYVLVNTALMLVCGRLGDLFGHRRMYLLGCAWSAAAFALCAAAPSYGWLLGARVLQGVGAALVLSVGPALATKAFDEGRRTRVLGFYTMIFAFGAAAGPPLAGELIAHWGWQGVYAARVPLAGLGFALAWLLPADRMARGAARFDALGSLLLVTAMAALVLGLDQAQRTGGWLWLGGLGLLSSAALAGFVRQQGSSATPLIAPGHLGDRGLLLALGSAVGVNLASFAILLLGPFLLARTQALSPQASGVLLAASPLGMVLAAPLAERLGQRIGMAGVTRLGLVVVAAGLAALGFGARAPLWMAAAMFVQGCGQGLFQVANIDFVTGRLPPRDRGVAGSLAMLTRTFGLMLGATLLMQLMRFLAGGEGAAAVVGGIEGTYRLVALLPLALLLLNRRPRPSVP